MRSASGQQPPRCRRSSSPWLALPPVASWSPDGTPRPANAWGRSVSRSHQEDGRPSRGGLPAASKTQFPLVQVDDVKTPGAKGDYSPTAWPSFIAKAVVQSATGYWTARSSLRLGTRFLRQTRCGSSVMRRCTRIASPPGSIASGSLVVTSIAHAKACGRTRACCCSREKDGSSVVALLSPRSSFADIALHPSSAGRDRASPTSRKCESRSGPRFSIHPGTSGPNTQRGDSAKGSWESCFTQPRPSWRRFNRSCRIWLR